MNSNNSKPSKMSAGAKPGHKQTAWAKERAAMDIRVQGHNWIEREEIAARKEFK